MPDHIDYAIDHAKTARFIMSEEVRGAANPQAFAEAQVHATLALAEATLAMYGRTVESSDEQEDRGF